MAIPSESELRSLVLLLDEDDAASLDLVCRQILMIGEPIIPYLEELRLKSGSEIAAKAESLARQVRFKNLREAFLRLSVSPKPSLEKGALLIARFGYPGLDPAVYGSWFDRVATELEDSLPTDADEAVAFQRLNLHVFQAMGFAGNETRYYDPDNSYLNRVIETRRGIPISLSVLYILLAHRLRLPVYGVGTPGHFLVAFNPGSYTCYIDTFHHGKLLDVNEVRRMLVRSGYEFREEFLRPCPTREILVRMMRNLISVYQKEGLVDRAEMLSTLVEIVLTKKSPR
ncbi:MAG: hypothetical protein HY921_06760 [Elusimicrobia bacterium]|nr:hypothetical protein [Elusimicrobiota bacterium]